MSGIRGVPETEYGGWLSKGRLVGGTALDALAKEVLHAADYNPSMPYAINLHRHQSSGTATAVCAPCIEASRKEPSGSWRVPRARCSALGLRNREHHQTCPRRLPRRKFVLRDCSEMRSCAAGWHNAYLQRRSRNIHRDASVTCCDNNKRAHKGAHLLAEQRHGQRPGQAV